MTIITPPSITPLPLQQLEKEIIAGEVPPTTDSNLRYLAYLNRLKPLLVSSSRYLAYTSDVGEAARPAVHQNWVRGAYGISWAYLIGDVSYEGYKSKLRATQYCPQDQSTVVGLGIAKRAIFQGTASMLFPMITIHTVVAQVGKIISKSKLKPGLVRTWGASVIGLVCIPFLPFIFDEPVEHVVDKSFNLIEEKLFLDRPDIRRAMNDKEGIGHGHDSKKEE